MWLPFSVDRNKIWTKQPNRRAFTLVEVILGSVLLSTLVVTALHGLRLHQRQLEINEHRIEAAPIAERLLTLWAAQPTGIPVGGSGFIEGHPQWLWQTQLVRTQSVFGQQVLVIRFEIIENFPTPGVVLTSVDFIKPAPAVVQPSFGPETFGPPSETEQPQPVMTETST
jgi:hypothetical protein